MAAKNIGMAILAVLEKLYGKSFINQIIGTRTNIIKPKELDTNAPTKNIFSKDAFKDEKLVDLADEKIMEYAPYILSNRNTKEQMNFLENAEQLLKARKKQTGSDIPDPKKEVEVTEDADIVDFRTGKTMDDEGIMSLKEDLGIPEGIDPRSTMGKAITEAGTIKRQSDDTLKKAVDTFFGGMRGPSKDMVMEGKRRAVIRKILLKDNRIDLPEDVRKSLENYDDLRGGGKEEMDPLNVYNRFYKRDIDKLDKLDDIIDVAENEVKAADEFLKDTKFDLVEQDLGDKLKNLPDDIDPDAMAEGGRPGKGLDYLMGV